MKRIAFIVVSLLTLGTAQAQTSSGIQWDRYFITGTLSVGQGVKNQYADPSAHLQLGKDSTNKGLLLPRVVDTADIPNPVRGLMVYQIKDGRCYVRSGSAWTLTTAPDLAGYLKKIDSTDLIDHTLVSELATYREIKGTEGARYHFNGEVGAELSNTLGTSTFTLAGTGPKVGDITFLNSDDLRLFKSGVSQTRYRNGSVWYGIADKVRDIYFPKPRTEADIDTFALQSDITLQKAVEGGDTVTDKTIYLRNDLDEPVISVVGTSGYPGVLRIFPSGGDGVILIGPEGAGSLLTIRDGIIRYGEFADEDSLNVNGLIAIDSTLYAFQGIHAGPNGPSSISVGSDATGDLLYRNSSGNLERLPVGSAGQTLGVSAGLPAWTTPTTILANNGVTRVGDTLQLGGTVEKATTVSIGPGGTLNFLGVGTAERPIGVQGIRVVNSNNRRNVIVTGYDPTNIMNGSSTRNSFFGEFAFQSIQSGTQNIGVGHDPGNSCQTCSNVVAIGSMALYTETQIDDAIAIGRGSLRGTGKGNGDIGIGQEAGSNGTTANSGFFGNFAGYNLSGTNNTVLGNWSNASPARSLSNVLLLGGDGANTQNVLIGGFTSTGAKLQVTGTTTATDDIEVTDATKGVILRSPDGNRWRIIVDNAGTISAVDLTP